MRELWAFHNSHDLFFRQPFGAVADSEKLVLRLKLQAPFHIESVVLRLWKNESVEELVEMQAYKEDDFWLYHTEITVPGEPGLLWYYFIIKGGNKTYYYGNNPENLGGIGRLSESPPNSYQVTVYKRGFKTPDWAKESVMYQIFVDRFYKGKMDKKTHTGTQGTVLPCKYCIIHENWDEKPIYKPDPKCGEILCNDFFGGNLPGIIEKLPYLKELGINVIYLNPIFEAYSNHKYDTGDYMKIDPMFGDLQIFKELCRKAGELGIYIILDGVFSHTGSDSIYFNKEGRYKSLGAYQSKDSPYYSWYNFIRYPEEYHCWWGIKTLPNVNEMDPGFMRFIIKDENSVSKYWLKNGSMGWRLDVVDELPDDFLKELRRGVKSVNPDALIIGEVWEDATTKVSYGKRREYLLGEELDSVMNYTLKDAILNFFLGHGNARDLHRSIMALYENYPLQSFYSAMNMVGNHDTTRVKTVLAGAPEEYTLTRDEQANMVLTPEQEKLATHRLKLVSLFQMTFPGIPCIYYGDEAGLYGYRDPFNRGTYPWGHEDRDLIEWYKKVINMRHGIDALKTGEFISVYYQQDVYGFIRRIHGGRDVFNNEKEDGFVLVLFNRSRQRAQTVEIDLGRWKLTRLKDILNRNREYTIQNGRLTIEMMPLQGRVLLA